MQRAIAMIVSSAIVVSTALAGPVAMGPANATSRFGEVRKDVGVGLKIISAILGSEFTDTNQVLEDFAQYERAGKLSARVRDLLTTAQQPGGPLSGVALPEGVTIEQLLMPIRAELYSRGYIKKDFAFKKWPEITRIQSKFVNRLPKTKNFRDRGFKQAFESYSGVPLANAHNLALIPTGPQSMRKRLNMINSADSSIDMLVWGFHDDESGKRIADALIRAHKTKQIPVRLVVDGLTSQRSGYGGELARMRQAGVEVVKWQGKENPYYGMHSKMLLVDGTRVLEGGRNIGDTYLAPDRWSDLDLAYAGGSMGAINYNHFAQMFNAQIDLQNLKYRKLPVKTIPSESKEGSMGSLMHYPNQDSRDGIYEMSLYAIENARDEIDIANAYFITTPSLTNALLEAVDRGVRVRIFTNSNTSLDEPALSVPILRSVKELAEAGAEVYLKQGETLHTKAFRADGLGWIGSYNWHPRSYHYEVEKATFFNDPKLVKQLHNYFNVETAKAVRVTDPSAIQVELDPKLDLVLKLLFNQL